MAFVEVKNFKPKDNKNADAITEQLNKELEAEGKK
jgi:hypothetical protein